MSNEHKGIEFFVGLFLFIGLSIIAIMVMIFGRVDGTRDKYYSIVVEFPNASGLVKGAYVLISGARVGEVADAPKLVDDRYTVAVPLRINERVPIPRSSTFQIRSTGMLGDSYVDVVPPAKFSEADYAKDQEVIKGLRTGGLDDLTSKGGEMIDKLNDEILRKLSEELDEIKLVTTNINTRLLHEKNLANIEATFENLKDITASFEQTSKDLDAVVLKADGVIKAAESAMKTTDSAAAEFKLTLQDFRKTADTTTRTIDSARILVNKAVAGEGTIGMLVSDKQVAADLKALIANLRRSGVLFYKNRPVVPAATPKPRRTR